MTDKNAENNKEPEVRIIVDGFKVYGPKVDGGYTVTLSMGEYEVHEFAKLLAFGRNTILEVIIKKYGKSNKSQPFGGDSRDFPRQKLGG